MQTSSSKLLLTIHGGGGVSPTHFWVLAWVPAKAIPHGGGCRLRGPFAPNPGFSYTPPPTLKLAPSSVLVKLAGANFTGKGRYRGWGLLDPIFGVPWPG